MRDDQECRPYIDHLVSEHRRLSGMIRRVRSSIVSSVEPDSDPSLARVASALETLRGELKHHFAQEEQGGCLEEAVSRCPKLALDAKRIESEHPQLLIDLDWLIAQAASLRPSPENQFWLQHECERLFRRLRMHEIAETGILRQAFATNFPDDERSESTLLVDL
jgi:hypothetical protein